MLSNERLFGVLANLNPTYHYLATSRLVLTATGRGGLLGVTLSLCCLHGISYSATLGAVLWPGLLLRFDSLMPSSPTTLVLLLN